jgi:DNA-binding PadR family transcriptional regulator
MDRRPIRAAGWGVVYPARSAGSMRNVDYSDDRSSVPGDGMGPEVPRPTPASRVIDMTELPLTPLTMAILISLAHEDQHGYALMREIGSQTGKTPGTGSLYAALERLAVDGLIAESPNGPRPDDDSRRKYFRITPVGRRLAQAEAARLERVLARARSASLTPAVRTLRRTS